MNRKMIGLTVLAGWMGTAGGVLAAGSWYVAATGNGSAGTSWTAAYTNLQKAIDAAAAGDTIYIAGHTFSNNTAVQLQSQLVWTNKSLTILSGYEADGGTPGSLTSTPTVLTQPSSGTNRIFFISGVTNGSLQRITIQGGSLPAAPNVVAYGGGIQIGACTNLLLGFCTVQDCVAKGPNVNYQPAYGGGIYATSSVLTLTNCVLERNSSDSSGTVNFGSYGSGLCFASGTLTLRNSIIRNNRGTLGTGCTSYGAGVYAGGAVTIQNCLLYGNNANPSGSGQGDGLYAASGAAVQIWNSTMAYQVDEGIRQGAGTVAVSNSILWANGKDVAGSVFLASCDIADGTSNGVNGCISASPLFQYGFYLDPASPCVNTGNVTAASAGLDARTTRIDGTPDSGVVDLGYHYTTGFDLTYAEVYVATNGLDSNSGTNALLPFRTLTNALATARDGTRIHIAAGSYTNGSETFPLTLSGKIGVQLLGTNRAATVINAAGASQRVLTLNNAAGTVWIEGMTLTGGKIGPVDNLLPRGAGLFLDNCADVTLATCAITNNQGVSPGSNYKDAYGGGIYAQGTGLTLTNCWIENNLANCQSSQNTSPKGAGVHLFSGQLRIYNSVIDGNLCRLNSTSPGAGYGGGVYAAGRVLLRNCLMYGNNAHYLGTAADYGDGLYLASGSMTVENSTIVTNFGQGINQGGGTVTVTNCILWTNGADLVNVAAAGIGYSDIQNGASGLANGCISADPQFASAATCDYRLLGMSPCINTATNLSWMPGALDLNGQPRIQGKSSDMGPYEFDLSGGGTAPVIDNGSGATNVLNTSAFLNGNLTATGAAPAYVWIFWDTSNWTTNKTWGHNYNFGGAAQTTNSLTCPALNLTSNTWYWYTCYASNAAGWDAWAWNGPKSFKTMGPPAVSDGNGATSLTRTTATLTGNLTNGANAYVYILWWTNQAIVTNTIAFGSLLPEGGFSTNLTGLVPGTVYYYRCFVSNDYGMAWADVATNFSTLARTSYVATNGVSPWDGSSWGKAFTNLQQALTIALDGDTIYIAGHTFSNNTAVQLQSQLVWTNKGLTILGGYAADGGTPGALTSTPTVLTQPSGSTNRILYIGGVTNGSLQRVTIQGGSLQAPNNVVAYGGGIQVAACSNLTLGFCTVQDSTAKSPGSYWQPAYGGGIYAANSVFTLTNCVLQRNSADTSSTQNQGSYGSGLCLASGTLTLRDSIIRNNRGSLGTSCTSYGAGVYAGGVLTAQNCLLYGNNANPCGSGQGDGLYAASGAAVQMWNCTLAYQVDEGIRRSAGTVAVSNSILWANSKDIVGSVFLASCDIADGTSNGVNGCISANPLFQYGFYLDPASPCVNTGNVTAAVAGMDARTTRIDGTPDSVVVDLGYHYATGFDLTYADVYVATNGSDLNAGTTPLTPLRTIARSLATAVDGTRIHIAAGSYTNGSEAFPLTLNSKVGVQLLGTNRAATVINAANANQCVLTMANDAGAVRIEALTLTGGNLGPINNTVLKGGCLALDNCADITLATCAITNNQVASPGNGYQDAYAGGIYAQGSMLTLTNCWIENNLANCQASQNTSPRGGGVYLYTGQLRIYNSVLDGNRCRLNGASPGAGYGGAAYVAAGSALVRNCLVYGNNAHYLGTAADYGDALYLASGSMLVESSTIVTNFGQGINRGGGAIAVTNSIIWNNGIDATGTVALAWSDVGVWDPAATRANCISVDPLFKSAATNDFRLLNGSPCFDAGTNLAWMAGALDLAGAQRLQHKRVDMGAYEIVVPPGGSVLLFR